MSIEWVRVGVNNVFENIFCHFPAGFRTNQVRSMFTCGPIIVHILVCKTNQEQHLLLT